MSTNPITPEDLSLVVILSSVHITEDEHDNISHNTTEQKILSEDGILTSITPYYKSKISIDPDYIVSILNIENFQCDKKYIVVNLIITINKESESDDLNSNHTLFSQFYIDDRYIFNNDFNLDELTAENRKNIYIKGLMSGMKNISCFMYNLHCKTE